MNLTNVNTISGFLLCAVFAVTTSVSADQSSINETTFAEVKAETRDLATTLKRFSADQRDEAIGAATEALFELDNRIRDFQFRIDNRWNEMGQSARAEARQNLRVLQRQRIELAEWYGGLKSDSGAAWNEIRKGFSEAYSEINAGWEAALREFQAESAS